jgi:hypothetical protein
MISHGHEMLVLGSDVHVWIRGLEARLGGGGRGQATYLFVKITRKSIELSGGIGLPRISVAWLARSTADHWFSR